MAPSRASLLVALALIAITLTVRPPLRAAQAQAATEPVDLVNGCTNVALTWPASTAIDVVVAAISPVGSVQAVWKLDGPSQQFKGFAPGVSQASDLLTVNPLDAVYVCTNAAAVMTRPVLGAAAPLAAVVPAAPVVVPLQIMSVTQTAARGGSASISVAAPPGVFCDIQYIAPAGSPLTTTGLGPKLADATGTVTWLWTIGLFTLRGQASVIVSCGTQVVAAQIMIV